MLNEYDRVSPLPGTEILTYWPGRNVNPPTGACTANRTVVGDSFSMAVTVVVCDAAFVFATADVLAICRTRSDFGLMLHGRQYPWSASSSVRASSM